MPEHGLNWLHREELMRYEEMLRLSSMLVRSGVSKIRITGGEPFVRKDMMKFLSALSILPALQQLSITTNGVLTAPHIPALKKMGIHSINLSLDTLDRDRFFFITRRDEFAKVMETMQAAISHEIPLNINTVVMDGKNLEDIIPLVQLTKDLPVTVRFIEEMPFNGEGSHYPILKYDHAAILELIKESYPEIRKIADAPHSTAYHYQVPGHQGKIGIIAAYTRSFCGTCNRIRVTPQGMLRTCLYDDGVLNLKELMRKGMNEEGIISALKSALFHKAKDGKEAEALRSSRLPVSESMATIGG